MANIDEKYPNLINSILSAVSGYEKNFASDEKYANVNVTYRINTSEGSVRKHIEWLLLKEGSRNPEDINLRDVEEYASVKVLPIPDIIRTEINTAGTTEPILISEPRPRTIIERPTPIPIREIDIVKPPTNDFIIPIFDLNTPVITSPGISGEGSRSNPQLGSSTSRGGVLGGRNFSNPQDAIDNEFTFRTRITDRER